MTAIGAATAIIVGCVAITPAAGYISPGWAMALGALAALPSYAIIVWRPRTRVDETLDVLAAHGIGRPHRHPVHRLLRPARRGTASSNGLLYGNAAQLGHGRRSRRSPAPAYAFAATFVMLRLIGAVHAAARQPSARRRSAWTSSQHGEEAYATGEGAILVSTEAALEDAIPVAQP